MYKIERTSFAALDVDGRTQWYTKHSTHEEIARIEGGHLQKLIADKVVTETPDEPPAPAPADAPTPARRTPRTTDENT